MLYVLLNQKKIWISKGESDYAILYSGNHLIFFLSLTEQT